MLPIVLQSTKKARVVAACHQLATKSPALGLRANVQHWARRATPHDAQGRRLDKVTRGARKQHSAARHNAQATTINEQVTRTHRCCPE